MVNYEQSISGKWRKNGESAPRDYFDPNVMLSERAFRLEPGEEILIVINGTGYRYNDDTIYELEFSFAPAATTVNNQCTETIESRMVSTAQLCFVIKNCAQNCVVYVGCKSPLQWLLDLPRISSKLCYTSIADITKCRLSFKDAINCGYDEVDARATGNCQQSADDETVVIRYT